MITKQRAQEISSYVADKGMSLSLKHFKITRETLRHYLRIHRRYEDGLKLPTVDEVVPINDTLLKIQARFSDKELKALLDSKSTHHDEHKVAFHNFTGKWIKFGIMSDCHIGSNYTNDDEIASAVSELNKSSCEMLLMPGDLTEGMSGRDGHVYELQHIGYDAQRQAAVSLLSKFKGNIKAISGNHDLWYAGKNNIGALVVKDICSMLPNAEYLGEHEGRIIANGASIDLWHGEDGASYALSYRIQKIVESLEGGTKPNMIIAGHDHKAEYIPNLRNVQAIEAGCLQHQSPWMRRKKLSAFVGFWIVELCIDGGDIVRVKPEWIPLF